MAKIVIKKWLPGMKKISLTMLFRHEAGLNLRIAKQTTDEILENKIVVIETETLEKARDLAKKATALGIVCEVFED